MKPLFSIIMPCYNSSMYIESAINSIIGQTYNNWELIIINDGSVDDTIDIINSFTEKDSRIKVYSKENGGYATAINYGLEKCTGDYFLMLGSDDSLNVLPYSV